ncbi:MAG TPA: sigma-70 family RNA polymerase sigma factor [Thermoanaerobaculia bacterium]|nr:sigma-70 family RNA polymerase sigma factor [Thermoanaerobaculia bacterium]
MARLSTHERFLSLLDEHKKIVFKVASSYCRDAEDRRDLTQEILAQLWRSFPRFDERQRFSTWMYRVAMNVAISFFRSETRRARHTVSVEESALEVIAVEAGDSDDIRLLRAFIDKLDPLNKALIILYLDGNDHETIAEVLGISATNVATKIGRIKQKLRRDFERT